MIRSALTISLWVICVWLCRDSTMLNLSGRAIYVWFCWDFDVHTEQCSAENRPTFRRIQTGLLCKERSNIFIRGTKGNLWYRSTWVTSCHVNEINSSSCLVFNKQCNTWSARIWDQSMELGWDTSSNNNQIRLRWCLLVTSIIYRWYADQLENKVETIRGIKLGWEDW